jgi:hypothetical protein
MSSDDLPDVPSPLGEQAAEIITEDTTWVDLAEQLDVDRFRHRDGHQDGYDGTPFRPMLLSYLWATVEGDSLSGIPHRLSDNPEVARAFGFEPGDLPSESTCKPVRLRDRFEDLESTVRLAAEQIRNVAAERGSPIGFSLDDVESGDADSKPSERTIDRLLRKNSRNVLDELRAGPLQSISIPQSDADFYDDTELLELEAIAAIKQCAANNGGKVLGDKKNPEGERSDPFYEDGPTGETLLETMKQMSVDEIATVMNFALRKAYTRAKPRLNELEHDSGSRFGTRAKIALDITYVAYYGEEDGMDWLQGPPVDKNYERCHKFATAVIVGENTHYVVGVTPLGSTDWADTNAYGGEKEQSHYVGDVARRLLSIADRYVNIRMVYADREFHAVDVVDALIQRDLDFIIPAQKNKRIKAMCRYFDVGKRGYHEENDTPLYVERDVPMHGSVKYDVSNSKVRTHVVLLPPDEDDDVHEEGSPQPFLTSLDVSDEIALDRRWARKQIEEYSDRAAIENSYSSIKDCAAWTTSKEFEVRWFHFAFACVVYNMWLLVDFLTQERIGVVATRKKPRITLSRFLDLLDEELVEFI